MNYVMSHGHKLPSYMMLPGIPHINGLGRRKTLILSDNQDAIIGVFMSYFVTDMPTVMKKTRGRQTVYHKCILSYILYNYGNMVVENIGTLYSMNHTTILHHIKSVKDQLSLRNENIYKHDIKNLSRLINELNIKVA
jgi:chromosomal replication initiation ATPase DnaA